MLVLKNFILKFNGIIVYVFVICLVISFISCSKSKKESSQNMLDYADFTYLYTEDSLFYLINIEDTAHTGIKFSFSLNNKFWFHPDSMLNFIRKIPIEDTFCTRKEIIQAWKFISKYTVHDDGIAGENKIMHKPDILLNSATFGLCDDRSAALCLILERMGYKTRISKISSLHVFAEVYDGEKWIVLDPGHSLLFLDDNSCAAGLSEIRKCMNLVSISEPHEYSLWYLKNLFSETNSEATLSLFKDSLQHTFENWFTENVIWDEVYFDLPAGSKIVFPVYDETDYAYMKINIPGYYCGAIKLPLLVTEINNGQTVFSKKIYENGLEIFYDLNLIHGENIEIVALMNPLFLDYNKDMNFRYNSLCGTFPKIQITSENNLLRKQRIEVLELAESFSLSLLNMEFQYVVNQEAESMITWQDFVSKTSAFIVMNKDKFDSNRIEANLREFYVMTENDTVTQNNLVFLFNNKDIFVNIVSLLNLIDVGKSGNVMRQMMRN